MPVKLTPVVSSANPKNTLRVKVEFMHGDADGYTHETFSIQNVPKNEELIERIINGISIGLSWMDDDDWHQAPFLMKDEDWNSTNIDQETGIPLDGAKLHFIHEVQHQYSVERKIETGTVLSANEDIIIIESGGIPYEIPNDEELIAPESAIPIIVDGYCGHFTIEGINVHFEGQGDHTCDNQYPASASINEVEYFDDNGTQFEVSGFY